MKKNVAICLLSIVLMSLCATDSWAVSIGFNPSSQAALVGDAVSVDLYISGLGDYVAPSLGAFDIDVLFDPLIVEFVSYELGPELGDLGFFEAMDLSFGEVVPGVVNVAELSLLDANSTSGPAFFGPYLEDDQPGSFTLATLTFNALMPGNGMLDFSVNSLGDAFGEPLIAGGQCGTEVITVSSAAPVPEPSSIVLLSAGLIGLGILIRKRALK